MGNDYIIIMRWWVTWLALGLVGWPMARKIFYKWEDKGYLMAKIIGAAAVTFTIWMGGSWKILPFKWPAVLASTGLVLVLSRILIRYKPDVSLNKKLLICEEVLFLAGLLTWSFVKGHEPSINGLEKFMDFGFVKSILRSNYFPPLDMWFAGETINYYYFGHLILAVVTKLSGLDLAYTFNLILATLFSLAFSMSFGIGRHLLKDLSIKRKLAGSLFIAFLVSLSGNLQTIYAFTKGYAGDDPPAFWKIWPDFSNWETVKTGWTNYWYPNATRFIPFTIHEFPGYSFVVSDIHGHVLGIPFALLAIALIFVMFEEKNRPLPGFTIAVYGWLTGMMFMTNTLDGPIYGSLWVILRIFHPDLSNIMTKEGWKKIAKDTAILGGAFLMTVFPFITNFQPFVSGLAINCPPASLENSKYGPILFETVEKCQKSPLWMMLLLWGLFVYGGLGVWRWKAGINMTATKKIFTIAALFCLGLIIFPEFFYFKDIYPAHFRSNTMFKLGYQVFIIMSLITGTILVRAINQIRTNKWYVFGAIPLVFLVSIYPWFSIRSYFGNLETYQGVYGLNWLEKQMPGDYAAVNWLNEKVENNSQPVILEANGDSYTNYERISTFTGLPTVAGWVVHEWLWRGSYDPIAKRAEEVRVVYESDDTSYTRLIIEKYDVKYIIVGSLEREKYPQLNEVKIREIATPVFTHEETTIYQII